MKPSDKELWQRRYEQLRQQVFEPGATLAQDRWGLSLLLRQGLAGWMRLWQDPAGATESVHGPDPVPASCPAPDWQQQATLLLVNMAWSHCHPSTPQPV
jgi:hypothetical protein